METTYSINYDKARDTIQDLIDSGVAPSVAFNAIIEQFTEDELPEVYVYDLWREFDWMLCIV